MRALWLCLGLISCSLFAQDSISFRNDREGSSYYSGNSFNRKVQDVQRDVSADEVITAYRAALRSTPNLCVYDINQKFRVSLLTLNRRFDNFEGAYYVLREKNEIDDVATGILLRAHKVALSPVAAKDESKLSPVGSGKVLEERLKLVSEFNQRLNGACFDQAYLELFSDLKKDDKKFSSRNLESLLHYAREKKIISDAIYVRLEQARANELEAGGLTLKDYAQKLRVLRTQFPLRDQKERSNFVATKADNVKMSYRQRLFENYNEVQIALMADMIRKLRRRIESDKIEIVVHNRDQTTETIPLEPMERFRFSIKKLRSEMTQLKLNSQFANRAPDYMDLIAASYEVSFVAGAELEQLAGLEDIWNPKKTFWEKANVWLKTFSSVASVVIPPPYGFIPTLVLVVIEATVIKEAGNPEDQGSLF
jgi:hypothetical protein